MGFAISNMQLKRSLPLGARNFKTVEDLHQEIVSILATGVGSRKISTFEILNDL
jgi:phage baseplate assembly protein W